MFMVLSLNVSTFFITPIIIIHGFLFAFSFVVRLFCVCALVFVIVIVAFVVRFTARFALCFVFLFLKTLSSYFSSFFSFLHYCLFVYVHVSWGWG